MKLPQMPDKPLAFLVQRPDIHSVPPLARLTFSHWDGWKPPWLAKCFKKSLNKSATSASLLPGPDTQCSQWLLYRAQKHLDGTVRPFSLSTFWFCPRNEVLGARS